MDSQRTGLLERQAFVFNIQKYSLYDGPGVRTIVFLKGCPLRCKWCANPESLERKIEVMCQDSLCDNCGLCVDACPLGIHVVDENGQHQVRRDINCNGCKKCVQACPKRALHIVGETKTISELLDIIHEDDAFYDMSGGGVTLSGGECTSQPQAAYALLKACKEDGLNTAIETCGYARMDRIVKIAEYVDLFLFDLKHMDPVKHNELTGVSNEKILANLKELLRLGYNVKVRMPMLKLINDSEEEINAIIDFLLPYKDLPNFKGIDLLPYHKLGVNKYAQLGIEYPVKGDPSLSNEDLDRIEGMLLAYDFPVKVIRH
ncbi:pyruvate formate lyase activating enzyme [Granulicatella balaenopterae]|uniref:Choline trimethylamine-lyase activating enzyme n=1 Tax=Granulicatella balaenopterae TaxID=137733 RepID=A0A1H9HBY6_9LACT|nr:choline TMA-lyase-activating enzyme [Granulicatella balaenopterae]SEQ59792.1 pyruvate formate lyase activating enzyme [Granulicatella balaenopterae]